jgi:hypothetical protein
LKFVIDIFDSNLLIDVFFQFLLDFLIGHFIMKKNFIFIAVTALVILLLYLLSTENVVPIPFDENHMAVNKEEMCLNCHDENKEYPRKKEHPPKDQCFKCHETAQRSVHRRDNQ